MRSAIDRIKCNHRFQTGNALEQNHVEQAIVIDGVWRDVHSVAKVLTVGDDDCVSPAIVPLLSIQLDRHRRRSISNERLEGTLVKRPGKASFEAIDLGCNNATDTCTGDIEEIQRFSAAQTYMAQVKRNGMSALDPSHSRGWR